jgi:hypothetical protein
MGQQQENRRKALALVIARYSRIHAEVVRAKIRLQQPVAPSRNAA